MNIAQHVERGARLFPNRPALHFEGQVFSYADLNAASNRAANAFATLGIQRGERVALWLPNTAAFIIAYLGSQKLGAVAVTINNALKASELEFILNDSGARLLLTTAALYAELAAVDCATVEHVLLIEGEVAGGLTFADLLQQAAPSCTSVATAPTDPAALLYTSGTTGFPKGALLSHETVVVSAQLAVATFGLQPTDRVLLCLSMFHSFAQTAALNPCFEVGATLILHRQFAAEPVLHSIVTEAATVFFGVPTLYILLCEQATRVQLQSVRRYISAGATLPVAIAHKWYAKIGTAINEGYGLTEVCLASFNAEPLTKPGSIGRPLAGVHLRVVNELGEPMAPGALGELLIKTPSLMLGYWQRPDATSAVVRDGWFHTGDVGRMDEDGYYYIVDRIKDMVNVGGVKVYPSEVEHVLYQHPAVREVAVYGVPEPLLGEQVQATVVLHPGQTATPQALMAFCRQHLAEFKAPTIVDFVEQLPKGRTGKILKRLLRDQHQATPPSPASNGQPPAVDTATAATSTVHTVVAMTALAQWLTQWLADQLQMAAADIEGDKPFADYGMTSVMAVTLARAVSAHLARPVPATLLWNFPTVNALANHLLNEADAAAAPSMPMTTPLSNDKADRHAPQQAPDHAIALVGIGCRFPGGANTPEQFWQLLTNGVDTARPIPADRWPIEAYYDPAPNTPGKMYVRAGHFLDEIDRFDAAFFGITPLEATAMDPQQRLLLEVCWEALEQANLAADRLRESRTGVYIGAFWDDYSAQHLYNTDPAHIDSYRVLSHLRGMTAGRLAYVLGLHGPAMQLDTACSSSLLAVHLACQALRSGECDLALAGGVTLVLSPEQVIGLCHMGAVAPDGRCKTFDAEADGFGMGEGAGVVVLKRLADAQRDGDRVLAVIRGSAVNHDGASNGLTAPNGQAQEALLRQALAAAAVQPEQVQYVETHGTGTVLGDPIEVQALTHVLGGARSSPLLLGSVKTNIGHLSAAAGVAALIKVVLALGAGEIPPSLHLTTPNPHIPWASAPLAVPTARMAWPPPAPGRDRRLAGVSSFGLTGTNVHLLVEEAPGQQPQDPAIEQAVHLNGHHSAALVYSNGHNAHIAAHLNGHQGTASVDGLRPPERPYHLLTLSAKSAPALAAQCAQLEQWLATPSVEADAKHWSNLCYTAAVGRSQFSERLAIVAPDVATARTKLQQAQRELGGVRLMRGKKEEKAPQIAFLFPGQGPQYVDMGRQLYETQPHFRRTLHDCAEILQPYLDQPLLELLYGADKTRADALLNEATYAQPALFAVEYALATLWRSWGIEPTVVMGHSLGEYVAACLAGVFSLEDGLQLVAARGRLMQTVAPKGRMVAVLGYADRVRDLLAPYAHAVALAAINTPQSVVIAGDPAAIAMAEGVVQQAGLETRPLKIYVASHSPLMDPILNEFAAVAQRVTYHRPRIRVVSNLTGALADEVLTTPDYWRRHLREPVQFAQGMATLATLGIDTFIETGPKATLLGLGQQCWEEGSAAQSKLQTPKSEIDPTRWLASLHPKTEDWLQLLESLATLYERGAAIDWQAFDGGYNRTKVALPRYPFQRQRYWLEAHAKPAARLQAAPPALGHPLLGRPVASALAARKRELLFEQRLELATLPYLADHRLFDQSIVPGAAYLEMILAAGQQVGQQTQLSLTECSIQQGLFLATAGSNEATGVTVQTILSPANQDYLWQIYSLPDGAPPDGWTLHASGTLRVAQAPVPIPHLDLAAVQARCPRAFDVTTYDQQLHDQGITYGPAFQALAQLWVGEGEALGHLTLPPAVEKTASAYQLHPVLLDAALRVAGTLMPTTAADPYLPFGVEQLRVYKAQMPTHLWSYVQERTDPRSAAAGNQQVDLTLLDETGQVVAQLQNFTLRRASRQALPGRPPRLDWLYEIDWKSVHRARHSPFTQAPGHWLILADRQGYGAALAAQLTAQGEQCTLLYRDAWSASGQSKLDNVRGVVFLWALDTLRTVAAEVPTTTLQLTTQALAVVQTLLQTGQSPRLWFVTQGAWGADALAVQPQQAPLWGMARTLHAEQPELACTCIEMTAAVDPAMLFAELWFADQEKQVLLRGEERLVARLARHQAPIAQPLRFDPAGSYLVTGGLGGLGLQVAQWLVDQGVRHLVLAGRRGVTTGAVQAAHQALAAAGAQVTVVQADVAELADARRLIAACQAIAPLRGIIHAAGVIDDGLLVQQTPARFAQVMAPKVAGSWHLHTLTHDLPLDFFVCFSSVASLLGNSGQSNYAAANAFMDALAQQRQKEGRPALSINWGGWAEVGLAAELVKQTAAMGLGAIAPAQGVALLGLLMTHQSPQVGVLPIEWAKFQQTQVAQALLPLLTELVASATAQTGTALLRQHLTHAPATDRLGLLKAYVQEVVTQLLGTTLADDESFFHFGLDSLLSIQLANRLAAALELTLPATLAFKYGTIVDLTQFLAERLGYAPDGTMMTAANQTTSELPTHPMSQSTNQLPDWYPQLYNQRECFIWHETVANKACLHIQQTVHIQSPVDVYTLEAALQTLVVRHEALRTVYTRRGDALLQHTLPTGAVDFAVMDVTHQPWPAMAERILEAARQPFDLAKGPFLRAYLFSRGDNDHLLLLVVHHIAADATALSVIVNELWDLYAALQRGQEQSLAPVMTNWTTFVRRQMALLQGQEGERLWRYWQQQIADAPQRWPLPTDYPRPAQDSHQGRPCYFEIDAPVIHALRQLAQQEGCTLYAVLMAGFQLLLHNYTQQRDLLIAAHVANRNDADLADVVGYLADTFPIRARIPEGITFHSLLQQVQATLLGAMEHQGFPLRLLAERLGVAPEPTHTALCQVWFTLLPLRLFQASGALFQPGAGAIQLGGLTLEGVDLVPAWLGAWYDLEMILTEGEEVVFGTLVYKTDLFTETTVLRMIAEFQTLLQTVAETPLATATVLA